MTFDQATLVMSKDRDTIFRARVCEETIKIRMMSAPLGFFDHYCVSDWVSFHVSMGSAGFESNIRVSLSPHFSEVLYFWRLLDWQRQPKF